MTQWSESPEVEIWHDQARRTFGLFNDPSWDLGVERSHCVPAVPGQMGSQEFLPTPDPPNHAWGLQAASQRWHRCHLSALFLLATTPNPHRCGSATKTRWGCFPSLFPALGSTTGVQHMPEDSLFSSGTQWGLLRSKVSSPLSCLWSLQ